MQTATEKTDSEEPDKESNIVEGNDSEESQLREPDVSGNPMYRLSRKIPLRIQTLPMTLQEILLQYPRQAKNPQQAKSSKPYRK